MFLEVPISLGNLTCQKNLHLSELELLLLSTLFSLSGSRIKNFQFPGAWVAQRVESQTPFWLT